jgi:hypothetical protein
MPRKINYEEILAEEEIKHFREILYKHDHDIANCYFCNPRFTLNLSQEEIKKIKDHINKDPEDVGIEQEKLTPEYKTDLLEYGCLTERGLIGERDEINKWQEAIIECREAVLREDIEERLSTIREKKPDER